MSDEEETTIYSDVSASEYSEGDETIDETAYTFTLKRSDRPKTSRPLVDHASLARQLENTSSESSDNQSLRMTKYEYARVKGVRMEQLQRGAIPCVDYSDIEKESVESIFRREFVSGRLPLMVIREMPDGRSNYIKIKDFVDRDASVYV